MSINVTVTGNPVSIRKGKMVTCDLNGGKKEFDKRRLMRLEQVRQQSKDIAEDVRNKVRKEKSKQMHEIEKEGKEKLRNWQNRKLLELQTQYKEALQELGVGHKQAVELEGEGEVLAEESKHNKFVANHRSQVAATRLQMEKNKENIKKTAPLLQKKITRDVENVRSSLVSSFKKKKTEASSKSSPPQKAKKRRRVSADINISIPASESDEKIDENFVASSEEEQIISHEITQDSEEPREPFGLNKSLGLECPYQEATARDLQPTCPCTKTFGAAPIRSGKGLPLGLPTGAYQHTRTYKEPPVDTRISDRIKRREIMASQPDYCDTAAEIQPTPFVESDTQIRDAINSRLFGKSPEPCNVCTCKRNQAFSPPLFDRDIRDGQYPDEDMSMKPKSVEDDIPTKPPVKLKENTSQNSKDTLQSNDPKKVGYYDHPNRFSQEKLVVPPKASVEKIAADSLEVLPNVTSEAEWKQKIKQRDREARIRGQRALERERIHKDYDDMMKQLPLLLKKERIAKIGQDKPKYHMTEKRLQELERERQNRLDNAYRKLFSKFKPKLVTLPVVRPPLKPGKKPPDYTPTTKAATWDVDCERKLYTTEEVQELIDRFTEQPHDRQERLNEFLKCLDSQKEQLLKELQSLPQDDSVDQLINDLTSVSDDSDAEEREKKTGTSERKRRREEQEKDSSAESNAGSLSSLKETEPIKEKKKPGRKSRQRPHSDRTKAPSPRKKAKLKGRKKVLILQNTSTQTTPKASSSSENKTDKIKRQHEQKTNQINRETQQVDKKTELVKDKMETFNQGTHQVKQRAEPVDKKTEQSDQKKQPDKQKGQLTCSKFHVPCDCNKENETATEELCQIFIKIGNTEPEVVVKSKEKENRISANDLKRSGPEATKVKSKSVAVGTDEYKPHLQSPKKKVEPVRLPSRATQSGFITSEKTVPKKSKTESKTSGTETRKSVTSDPTSTQSKSKSWREQLSKNSTSTTSTSYFSPPDFRKVEELLISGSSDASKLSFYNLRKKPRQGNLNESTTAVSMSRSRIPIGEKSTDPSLLRYIKKLLSKSRESIENLTVSTSSIQTPSQSIVEMESNNPMAQVHNIIKYLNLRAEDIAEALRYTPDPDPTSPRYNTSASSSDLSQIEENKQKEPKDVKKSTTSEKGTTNTSSGSKNSILLQYADVTDCCSKRIATLAAMINQIREDKIKLLSDSLGNAKVDDHSKRSDKDHSTAYLDLPDSRESSKHSTSTSLDDDELHRRLIEIDMSLAKKLRGLSPVQQKPRVTGAPASSKDDSSSVDNELWERLQRLMQNTKTEPPKSTKPDDKKEDKPTFVPFLSDIPILPKLEIQPETDTNNSNHRKPPPSKGLTVAKKFNGNISLIPHELSTIIEADSQLSTKASSSKASPNASKTSQGPSPRKNVQLLEKEEDDGTQTSFHSLTSGSSNSEDDVPDTITKISITTSPKRNEINQPKTLDLKIPPLNLSYDLSNKSILLDLSGTKSTISSNKSFKVSSASSDDLETIESMLKSIGMEWAIPTLHKTHEALALTSSSSSLEMASKNKSKGNESGGSEVSLKEFLRKQVLTKISSSTMKSDSTPVSLSSEFSETSSIQVISSAGKDKPRTSTPLTTSKSGNKSMDSEERKLAFSAGSDISSVRRNSNKNSTSEKHSFHSLSD